MTTLKLMRTIFIILIVTIYCVHSSFCQTNKVGLQVGVNEIFYHTGRSDDGLPDFNVRTTSANAAMYFGYKWKQIGASFEPGIMEKKGLFERDLDSIYGFQNEFHINLIGTFDYHPLDVLSISVGPEFTFPISNTQFSDADLNIGSLIMGVVYSPLKRLDIGLRYKLGLFTVQGVTFTDDFGNPVGRAKYYNDYVQLFFRFNIFNQFNKED